MEPQRFRENERCPVCGWPLAVEKVCYQCWPGLYDFHEYVPEGRHLHVICTRCEWQALRLAVRSRLYAPRIRARLIQEMWEANEKVREEMVR